MINDTMARIENMIKNSGHITEENKAIYLELLKTLGKEISELSKTQEEQAVSISGFTKVSTHEAIREEKNSELMNISLKGLQSSVEGFEVSNPNLVSIVNSICSFLSNLGI
ncbi:MAG: DUF4404 family protein [Proteobacteria bacterium]|nr:DUF4404 family protein [Pseudomonadota bacterium]